MLDFDIDEAKYRVEIKHELRRLGVPFEKTAPTEALERLLLAHN